MKKFVLFVIASVVAVSGMTAQNTFFPTKEGTKLDYAYLDAKGKATNYNRLTIKQVEGSGQNMTITYGTLALDKNRIPDNSIPEVQLTIVITNGVLEWDMKSFAAPGTEGLIQFEGDKLRIPSSLAPGVKLDDVKFALTLNMGFKIRTECQLTEQECLAIEDVTVPAGTFKCYKVTQKSTATVMRKAVVTKTITWYSPNIGTIKSETYTDKDKLQSSTELIALEN